MIDLSRARTVPYKHQVVGVEAIVNNEIFFLADEMGAGKTKQAIDAAQVLFERQIIDRVLVLCPAAVRDVWFNKEWGELAKHCWLGTSGKVLQYHAKTLGWFYGNQTEHKQLVWTITNYEFLRSKERLARLLPLTTAKTLLILDESSAVKNHRAEQTKSALSLRRRAGRVLLLNGTPIANSPLDMYSQGNLMDPRILACQSYFQFRSRYAVLGGFQQKQIIGWVNLDDMQRRFKPFILRRLKSECLDLPPKLAPVTLTVPLSHETWHLYRQLRDELLVWLSKQETVSTPQAVVKALRLAQITSGFVGGVNDDEGSELQGDVTEVDPPPPWVLQPFPKRAPDGPQSTSKASMSSGMGVTTLPKMEPLATERGLSHEKQEVTVSWVGNLLNEDRNLKLLIWCRFRHDIMSLKVALQAAYPSVEVGLLWGGQKPADRSTSLRLLDPRTAPQGPVIVLGTRGTGSMGLNLSAAHTVLDFSHGYSLKDYMQAQDRVHRPGQTYPVSYYRLIATGPAGQKTIDHAIIKALDNKENIATWTTEAWRDRLQEE